MAAPASPPVPLLAGLAERIARRDLPPLPLDYDPNDPAQVLAQVLAALAPLIAARSDAACRSRARILLEFIGHDQRSSTALAHAAGLARVAGSRALVSLERAGLLQHRRDGPRHVYRLTRWGEDWLLAVAKGEAAPGRPGGTVSTS